MILLINIIVFMQIFIEQIDVHYLAILPSNHCKINEADFGHNKLSLNDYILLKWKNYNIYKMEKFNSEHIYVSYVFTILYTV